MNMKTMTMTLFRHFDGFWAIQESDPRLIKLFGTDVLPTAFRTTMEAETVRQKIQRLNPDKRIEVKGAPVDA